MKDKNSVVMKTHWKSGLRRILLRGLSEKMAFKLKSSGFEGAIPLESWGELFQEEASARAGFRGWKELGMCEALTEAGMAAASESRAEGRGRQGGRGPRARIHWRSMRRPWCVVLRWEMTSLNLSFNDYSDPQVPHLKNGANITYFSSVSEVGALLQGLTSKPRPER